MGIEFLISVATEMQMIFHINSYFYFLTVIFKCLFKLISDFPNNVGHFLFSMDNTAKRIYLEKKKKNLFRMTMACFLFFLSSVYINV